MPAGLGVHLIDRFMTPEQNLEVQTQVISRARAFVGTDGGLMTYVWPFYDVPSVGFYSNESELVPAHLDVGWRLGRFFGNPALIRDTHSVGVLRMAAASRSLRAIPWPWRQPFGGACTLTVPWRSAWERVVATTSFGTTLQPSWLASTSNYSARLPGGHPRRRLTFGRSQESRNEDRESATESWIVYSAL